MTPATLDRFLWRSTRPAPSHPQTVMADSEDARVRIRDTRANGPTVVFFCDPPVTVEHYDALIDALGDAFRVLVVELPAFGFSSPKSDRAFEFEPAVAAVEAALAQLRLGPAVVCGPCICGFVAMELARRANLDIAGLILVQTPDASDMQAWTEGMDPKGRLRTPYLGQVLVRTMAKRLVRFWFRYATGRDTDHRPLSETATGVLSAGGRYPLASMLQRWRHALRDRPVQLPALVVWGAQDRSHRDTDRNGSLKHVPDAEIATFAACGHFPELEDPAGFVSRAEPFLKRCLG